jgi:two-component system, OmpR family, copper resistance phosphate regulon response regulator CusR
MQKILLVDDEGASRESLGRFLADRGYPVAQSSHAGIAGVVESEEPAAVLIVRPGVDDEALAICRALHDRGSVMVLFLAVTAGVADRIAAYEAGADDVMVGVVTEPEIDARLRAMLRRSRTSQPPENLVVGDLRIDRARHRVTRAGEEIPLTLTEFNLLEYFARRKNTALTRKEILEAVWGGSVEGFTNIVDVYVNYLRKKIERSDRPKLLKTVRGVGYMVEEPGTQNEELGAAL